jgi:hypothetical protein
VVAGLAEVRKHATGEGLGDGRLRVKIPHHFLGAPAADEFDEGDARSAVEEGGGARGGETANQYVQVEALCCGMEAEESGEIFVGDGAGSARVVIEGV